MPETIHVVVNGEPQQVVVEPHLRLLDMIREVLGLTGTKEGCGTGDCGACTVLLDGEPITSCCTLGVEADGHSLTTVEGLSRDGRLHPIQRAFVEHGALQCGFCTPGFLVASKALLDRHLEPTLEDIREGLAGNLCRCTGYAKIIEAIYAASREIKEGAAV